MVVFQTDTVEIIPVVYIKLECTHIPEIAQGPKCVSYRTENSSENSTKMKYSLPGQV